MTVAPKFYSPRPLSEQELFKRVPSIFTTEASPDRSERFTPIPTIEAVRALAKANFLPYGASESFARKPGKAPYVKHMLKFRKEGAGGQPLHVGDNILEVVMTNGNDGSKAYGLDAGFFRIACLNGLVVKSEDFGSIKIRHTGMDTLYRVLEGSQKIVEHAELALKAPQDWSNIILDDEVRMAFAVAAHHARFGEEKRISAAQLLVPRRPADTGKDLWSLLNVVQENVVEGGVSAIRPKNSAERQWTTRRINAVDSNLRINKQLWELAERVAKGQPLLEKVAA